MNHSSIAAARQETTKPATAQAPGAPKLALVVNRDQTPMEERLEELHQQFKTIDLLNKWNFRDKIDEAVEILLDTPNTSMGDRRSCPNKATEQAWQKHCKEPFAQSVGIYFMRRAEKLRKDRFFMDPAYKAFSKSQMDQFAQRTAEMFTQVDVRESWHLYNIGLSPRAWMKAFGQSYEETMTRSFLNDVATRRKNGEKIEPDDFALNRACFFASAAGAKTQADLPKKIGMKPAEWSQMTGGIPFHSFAGEMRRIDMCLGGKRHAAYSFYPTATLHA